MSKRSYQKLTDSSILDAATNDGPAEAHSAVKLTESGHDQLRLVDHQIGKVDVLNGTHVRNVARTEEGTRDASHVCETAAGMDGNSGAYVSELSDDEIIEKVSKDGARFKKLLHGDWSDYRTHANGELALCLRFGFYCGADAIRIDRLFRRSTLYRAETWDEQRGDSTHGHTIIGAALERLGKSKSSSSGTKALGNHGGSSSGLPSIIISRKQLREISSEACSALAAANIPPKIFVRGGMLVSVRRDENDRALAMPLREDSLRGHMTRSADYFEGEKARTGVSPPLDVVKDILSLGRWTDFPVLSGITQVPIIRPDGTIFDQPGYDETTRLFYAPSPGFTLPTIPENPTQQELEAAKADIRDAIGQFPYADDPSEANAFGLLVTLVVRHMVAKAPIALIDAPDAGTGKGLLAEVLTLIATGKATAMMGAPKAEEEWRKQITSLLLSGASVILIDNVSHPLASSHLCRALTASEWQDRILGVTKEVVLPQKATWIAAGNNIRLGSDMPRRCFWIRLNAKRARPWKRTGFRHDNLLGWAADNRGKLIAAPLILFRAWYSAGRPQANVPAFGSYENWANTVGSTLAFAGVEGFLANLEALYETADTESPQWEAFLATLYDAVGERVFTVAELVTDFLYDGSALLEALPEELADSHRAARGSFQHKLGRAFSARIERRHGDAGFWLERAPNDTHAKVARWRVTKSQ